MGPPVVAIEAGIFVHQQISGIYSLPDLKPYVIGVVDGSSHLDTLTRMAPGIAIKTFTKRDELYRAALGGEFESICRFEPGI